MRLRQTLRIRSGGLACGVAIDAIGPLAITDDMPVARAYRDAKLGEIGEGTSEVMRMIIAKT